MKTIKTSLLFLLFLSLSNQIFSQYQIGVISSFEHGNLINPTNLDFFDSNETYGFGLAFKKELQINLYINSDITIQKIGLVSQDYKVRNESSTFDLYWKGKSLNLSTDIGYYFLDTKKFKIGTSMGLVLGFILDQEYKILEDPSIGVTEFYTKKEIVSNIKFNLDFMYKISQKWTLNARPNWNQNLAFDSNKYLGRNLGVEMILWYTLNNKKGAISPG